MAVTVLLRLAALTGETRYAEVAEAALRTLQPVLAQYPTAFAQWLSALCFHLGRPREVALVGDPAADPAMQAMLDVVFQPFRPFQVVALKGPGAPSRVPLMVGREALNGQATAAVCVNFTCRLPVTDPTALRQQLDVPEPA
jgi:uncharacterized protein YyaL (SSP411 family)